MADGVRELTMARWGMPSPTFAIAGKKTDPGVTNIRNVKSSHWRRWLGVESRCVVPSTKAEKVIRHFAFLDLPKRTIFHTITLWQNDYHNVSGH